MHKVQLRRFLVLKVLLERKVHKDQLVHKVLQVHKALLRQLLDLKAQLVLKVHRAQLVLRDLEV